MLKEVVGRKNCLLNRWFRDSIWGGVGGEGRSGDQALTRPIGGWWLKSPQVTIGT